MSEYALLTEVIVQVKGSALTSAAAVSATQLVVEYGGDFNASSPNDPLGGGGTLDLNGVQLAYTDVVEGALPTDPDTLLLASPLANAAAVGDVVSVVEGGQVSDTAWAVCSMGEDGDQVMVPLRSEQRPFWPVGPYDPPVAVQIAEDLGELYDAPGWTPQINGDFLEPGTVPSDGNAPASSPTPTIQGGIGSLFVKWTPVDNYDPVTYEVHMSTTSGVPSPGPGTLVAETPGSTIVIRKDAAGLDLAYGTTYYVKIRAKDEDGPAAIGSQASGSPIQVNTPDIAVNAITANEIAANAVTASEIAANAVTATAISSNAVTTAKLDANAVTAAKIAAGTITATEIASNAITAAKIDATAIDGKVITGAKLRTAGSGERLEIQSTGAVNSPGQVAYYTADVNEDPARPGGLFGDSLILGSSRSMYLRLLSPGLLNDVGTPVSNPAQIDLYSHWDTATDQASTSINVTAQNSNFSGNIQATGNLDVSGDVTIGDELSVGGNYVTGPWNSYTPTWTGTTTNPTGHTRTGFYQVLGKTCRFKVKITFTSSSNLGSGAYLFGLPTAAIAGTALDPILLNGLARDVSASSQVYANGYLNSTTNVVLANTATGAAFGAATYPWASGDVIWLQGEYEIA